MVMNNMPNDNAFAQIEAGTQKVTDDWFLTTLKQYKQLAPFFEANSTGTASEPLQQLFASGKAAMLATGSFHISPVRQLGATFPIDLIAPITVSADKAKYEGIYNATFILGVNTAGTAQDASVKWLEFLSDPSTPPPTRTAPPSTSPSRTSSTPTPTSSTPHPWLEKKTLLAPRFQFNNLDIRNAVEASCVAVVGGTAPEQAAAAAQTDHRPEAEVTMATTITPPGQAQGPGGGRHPS